MNYANIIVGNQAKACQEPLRINDKNVGFLIAPLMEHCCFKQSSNRKAWCLTFFKESSFERAITIFFHNTPDRLNDPKALWIDTELQPNHQVHAANASLFLRGSNTKSIEEAIYQNKHTRLLVDRENMVLFSNNGARFERVIICQALAMAYKDALSSCMFDLTECIKANDENRLITLYEDMLRFNAADYFIHPIDQQKSHELFDIWEKLSRHWRLDELRQELTSQLADVANLIKEKRSQQEQKDHQEWQEVLQNKDRSFNRKALVISVFVATLSLFTLFQLTPSTFSTFWSGWTALFSK